MKAVPSSRHAHVLTSLLPNFRASPEPVGAHARLNNDLGEASATLCSADDKDSEWDQTAAFSDDVESKMSVSTVRRVVEQPTVLFEYFRLLCAYHGAARVPAFWASMLAGSSLVAHRHASVSTDRCTPRDESDEEEDAELFYSRATALDFSSCYAGPKTLLAFADLCRVHRVALAQRHRHPSPSASRSRTRAVVVRAVAPLWSKGAAPSSNSGSSPEAEEMCSLLPRLRTVRLVRLSLDFSSDATSEQHHGNGNKVLLYVLEALQGHPCLHLLDLSGNPVASALVPALSRLLQSTPSLTTVVLDDTLLQQSEKRMLLAQCRLNQLRLAHNTEPTAAAAASSPATGPPSSPLSTIQTSWSAQTLNEVQRALEVGVSSVPWLLGNCTAYIRRYTAQTLSTTSVSSTTPAATGSSALRKASSYATVDSAAAAAASTPSGLLSAFRPSTEVAYLCYDAAEAAAAVSSTARVSSSWTPECAEVVRSAFLDRQVARQRVLGGRSVWANVPLPEDAEGGGGGGDGVGLSGRPTAEALSSSSFLKSIRQQLLPPPQAPPGMRHDTDADLLTTAEENYVTICQTQDKQWGYLAGRLAELLEPVQLQHNQVLYTEGEADSQYVYFLPTDVAESQACVTLHAGGEVNRVLPGQWVGEAEVLGCMSLYSNAAAPTKTSSSVNTNTKATKALGASPFARHSTARFATCAQDGNTVWALPFSVAFFYLYAPYQRLQQQFLQRTPMSAFAQLHPVLLASVPVQLELGQYIQNASSAAQRAAAASAVLCTSTYLASHLVLLQEGEFLLGVARAKTPTLAMKAPEAEDRHLLSGNAVATQAVFDFDANARAAESKIDGEDVLGFTSGDGRALGKEAALRQYRVRKAAQPQRSAASSAVAEGADVASPSASAKDGQIRKSSLELRPYPSSASVTRWRYAGLSNEAFMALCLPLRLSLTRHCCLMPNDEA
ncbi:hypothetical protein ABB37_09786 [Leptomonas pyrrhocoris]|uniref:Uncharacterized protein n=1 Tax=Leptomonas pyrrhocoris TaxID=157538 RepID=A0A0N0VCT6_LEPPY|nr:hypothetical protein ABB37_09786 [Leptomonas pyrrhocoris]KPA73458.1 hypothetical protein ABB37_09786 [Leptomonas pyrrhocoris]|eukprot:XP_015651897.1 hypothetical protein ABB37_09786 [Leptomonas pyrrhocoris]